jgi:hypothetical protein
MAGRTGLLQKKEQLYFIKLTAKTHPQTMTSLNILPIVLQQQTMID